MVPMSVIKITIRQLLLNCYNLKPNLEVFYRTIYGAFPNARGSFLTPRRKALLLSERAARLAAESEAKALLIERLRYPSASPRSGGTILEQLELELSDPEEDASEAEATAQIAAARTCGASRDANQRVVRCPSIWSIPMARACTRTMGGWCPISLFSRSTI